MKLSAHTAIVGQAPRLPSFVRQAGRLPYNRVVAVATALIWLAPLLLRAAPPPGDPKGMRAQAESKAKGREMSRVLKSLAAGDEEALAASQFDFNAAVKLALEENDQDSQQAIRKLLRNILPPKGAPSDPERFNFFSHLLQAIVEHEPAQYRQELQPIYENKYKSDTLEQLSQMREYCRIIHPAMLRLGVADHENFERSEAYKRLVRARHLLLEKKS